MGPIIRFVHDDSGYTNCRQETERQEQRLTEENCYRCYGNQWIFALGLRSEFNRMFCRISYWLIKSKAEVHVHQKTAMPI